MLLSLSDTRGPRSWLWVIPHMDPRWRAGLTDVLLLVRASSPIRHHQLTFPPTRIVSLQVWDASTGELLHTLDGPGGEVEWLGWHPRGPVVLAGSADGTVWMWDVTRRALANCMQVFAGHEEGVTAGGFDPAGKTVYTGSADGGVRAFNPKTAACMHVYRLDAPVNALAFHPSADKPLLAVGTQDGVAAVINTATSKVLVRVQHTPPEELAEKAAARAAAAAAAGEEGEEEDDDAEPATRSVERCVQGCVAGARERGRLW